MSDELNLEPLEKAYEQLLQGFEQAEQDTTNALLRDGVIQRFEYTMDLSCTMMQRVLKTKYEMPTKDITAKKDIIRQAEKVALIADAEVWIKHYDARNATSHDYNLKKAEMVYAQVKPFLPDAKKLLEALRSAY
jgi:nucleotidyltransferase substrate binding protein (TIGR01987 family)